jgi:hypothetical protein
MIAVVAIPNIGFPSDRFLAGWLKVVQKFPRQVSRTIVRLTILWQVLRQEARDYVRTLNRRVEVGSGKQLALLGFVPLAECLIRSKPQHSKKSHSQHHACVSHRFRLRLAIPTHLACILASNPLPAMHSFCSSAQAGIFCESVSNSAKVHQMLAFAWCI